MTSLKFQPDPGAKLDGHWSTVFLSTRDASGQIPINFITHAGVHLTQACFSNRVYDDLPTQSCISDLFASQVRRLVIDLYWDNINRRFNLCPVELPPLAGNASAGYSVDSSALFSITASTSFTSLFSEPTIGLNGTQPLSPRAEKRQDSASFSSASSLTSSNSNSTTGDSTSRPIPSRTSDVAIPTSTGASGGTLIQMGPYVCSLDLSIGSIISLYNDYLGSTADTVSARLQYLDINLHAAAPFTNPTAPADAPTSDRMPGGDELIGAMFVDQLDKNVYTPHALQEDRQNLNQSWYRDTYRVATDDSYFSTFKTGTNGDIATHDGWPGENWVLLTDNRRMILAWGEIDPQMAAYDFRTDAINVFNDSDLVATRTAQWDDSGDLTAGCFYKQDDFTVFDTNSSWAVATIGSVSGSSALNNLARNLTACGISPVVNMTVGSTTVPEVVSDYQDFVRSSVYGWAEGEPSNASSIRKARHSGSDFRCAMLDSTTNTSGKWRVDVCQKSRRAACRIGNSPYAWRLTTGRIPFDVAPDACPEHTTFDLPRTGLENTYLYQEVLNVTKSLRGDEASDILEGIWINFNSLDQAGCWVIGGPNATCLYSNFAEKQQQRQVLIPTIAALIILVLSVLTLLVKCNQNRPGNRGRRRGEKGWEYEGIPS